MATFQVPNGLYMDPGFRLFYPEDAKMTDGIPEELKPVLHSHWESFPPQHPLVPYFFGVFLFILSFISLVGNTLILYIFLTTKSLRTPVSLLFKVQNSENSNLKLYVVILLHKLPKHKPYIVPT